MPGAVLLSRVPRFIETAVTFEATVTGLAAATITLWTITQRVLITHLSAFCTTSLTESAGTTLELGTVNNSAGLIAQVSVTDLDAGEYWNDATPEAHVANAITDQMVGKAGTGANGNVIYTVGAGGNITAGVVVFAALWLPMSPNGNLA